MGHLQHIINAQPKYGSDRPSHIDTTAFDRMGIFTLKMTDVCPNDMTFVQNGLWTPHQT